MTQMIFVNLPVRDLAAAKAFFEQLGYRIDPRFTDDKAACVVISDAIYAMLLTEPFFAQFLTKPQVDGRQATEVLLCLSAPSREEVDRLVAAAVAAGGREPRPAMDHGFMYGRTFEDLDGHVWEIMWMDPTFAAQGIDDPRHQENPPQP
ncbi:glyoxalase [Siculibacillus lacustris]|uniref:Glyoxalase n=1 Tax=Siculibacillus lacustris TaxID=1549641 RepID=A0A4Q9VUF9_9HYPH|nr:VOC family protein [Siculibacillus lacustris]TBW39812.1 glyoxalase [Siculibacillus lacustris]